MSKKVKLTADAYIRPDTKAGDVLDLEDNLADRLVQMKVAEHHKEPEKVEIPDGEPSDAWKVNQLKAYADREEVDLGDAKTKADILASLEAAKKPETPAE